MKMKKMIFRFLFGLALALGLTVGLSLTAVAEPTDMAATPLTLEAKTAGTIVVSNPMSGMQYTKNGGPKTAVNGPIDVAVGDTVQFFGNGTSITSYRGTKIAGGAAQCYIYGNIMSLVDETGFSTADTVAVRAFESLFDSNGNLFNHSTKKLVLPATKLADSCYYNMFIGCSNLTEAPELPATTLANCCYQRMFIGCTSLTEVPDLPATTLAAYCYQDMFTLCTSLTEAPDLSAMELAEWCCDAMFYQCTSLTTAPALPATTLAESCYERMFYGCTSLTKAPTLPAMTLATSCYNTMFRGCTALTEAPALPATVLADACYADMFADCTALSNAPALPAATLARQCYYEMFSGCTSLTEAPALPATVLADACYAAMFDDCTALSNAPALPAETLAKGCYEDMFSYCTSLIQAPELPATSLAEKCYYEMFTGCKSLETAPTLPAATLKASCYEGMFFGCNSLNAVTCLATDISASRSTFFWLYGAASAGTFTKAEGMTGWQRINSNSGIPAGWTVKGLGPMPYIAWNGNKLVKKTGDNACQEYSLVTAAAWGEDSNDTWYVVESDVTIDGDITVTGNVHLILCDEKTLTVNKITGRGSLTVYAQSKGDKIGALKSEAINTSNITIDGGQVTATSSNGISAENYVAINGGRVTANSLSTGIYGKNGVTINGGIVMADCGQYGISTNGSIIIAGGEVTAAGSNNTRAINGIVKNSIPGTGWTDMHGEAGRTEIPKNPEGQALSYKKVQFTPELTSVSYIAWDSTGDAPVSETRTCTKYIVVDEDTTDFENGKWYVVANDVTVGERISVTGTAHLILVDGKTLNAGAGFEVEEGRTLNIYAQGGGTGKLSIDNVAGFDAGIGGNRSSAGGSVIIHGGTVTVAGSSAGAAIGGGEGRDGGDVTVYDGTVKATGGIKAAGIGGGEGGAGGAVTVYGGTVTAVGGNYAAGIGGGQAGNGGTVNIHGGTVNATGKMYGAGIGGGGYNNTVPAGNGGTVNIYGGTVTATGDGGGAGIGCGGKQGDIPRSNGGAVNIYGGTVIATGTQAAAGIGGGIGGDGGTVTISDGTVTATGNNGGAGIGRGMNGSADGDLKVATTHVAYSYTQEITDENKKFTVKAQGNGTGAESDALTLERMQYMRVEQGKLHSHNFTYSADGETITATCDNGDLQCDLTENKVTLTIVAPTRKAVGGTGEAAATLEGLDAFNGATALGVAPANIRYVNSVDADQTEIDTAPTDAGNYTAKITLEGVRTGEGDNDSVTASVDYEITMSVTNVTLDPSAAQTVTVGGKVSFTASIEPANATDQEVIWSVDNSNVALYTDEDCTIAVGTAATSTLEVYAKGVSAGNATVTVTSSADSNKTASCEVTVNKAAAPTIDDVTDTLLCTATSVSESVAGKMPEDAQMLTYTAGTATKTGNVTVSEFVVDNDGNVTATLSGGAENDTITLPVTISSANYADSTVNVVITLIAIPTYTVTYKVEGGTWSDDSTADKSEIVQSGSKPASVPTGMKASEGFTGGAWDPDPTDAAITEATTFTYAFTEKQPTIVTKAPASKALTYNGQAQELVDAGTAEGGEMWYAPGENATTAPADSLYATSIPTGTDAGIYYVWYKVVGDESHLDTEGMCVTASIAALEFGDPDFVMPEDLTDIEESAFEGVTAMSVVDAHACASIGKDAFKGTGLAQIRLPKDCAIDSAAFDEAGIVYVYAPSGGTTQAYCEEHDNLIFVAE